MVKDSGPRFGVWERTTTLVAVASDCERLRDAAARRHLNRPILRVGRYPNRMVRNAAIGVRSPITKVWRKTSDAYCCH